MTIDELAQAIRKINGFSSMGAGQLAEELHPSIARRIITLEYERNIAESRITTLEAAIAECRRDAESLRSSIGIVLEGWTLPDGARKTLEKAMWNPAAIARSETNDDA